MSKFIETTNKDLKWNGRSGPEGQAFILKFLERLKELGNDAHTVSKSDVPLKADNPTKTSTHFCKKHILNPTTRKPLKQGSEFITDPTHEAVVAVYPEGFTEVEWAHKPDDESSRLYDNYLKDQKQISINWKDWDKKVTEFFTLAGECVPEANRSLYAEHLDIRYPKGAFEALQAYINPPNEQGGFLDCYGRLIALTLTTTLVKYLSDSQKEINNLKAVGEEPSEKFRKFLLINAIRRGPHAENFKTTLEILQTSCGQEGFEKWCDHISANESRAEFSSAMRGRRTPPPKQALATTTTEGACKACNQFHDEGLRDCPHTWWCQACKWRHPNPMNKNCDKGAAKRAYLEGSGRAQQPNKSNAGSNGKGGKGGKQSQDPKGKKNDKPATTRQVQALLTEVQQLRKAYKNVAANAAFDSDSSASSDSSSD